MVILFASVVSLWMGQAHSFLCLCITLNLTNLCSLRVSVWMGWTESCDYCFNFTAKGYEILFEHSSSSKIRLKSINIKAFLDCWCLSVRKLTIYKIILQNKECSVSLSAHCVSEYWGSLGSGPLKIWNTSKWTTLFPAL